MKQGDVVLIWGASRRPRLLRHPDGAQRRRHPGLRRLLARRRPSSAGGWAPSWSSTANAEGYRFWKDEHNQDPKEWQRFGKQIRELTGGDDPDIVFEHPGRETFGATVYVTRRGGTIVTCASTTGFVHEYDNRYLWMNLKRIVGSHFANYREAWEANRLIAEGPDPPDAVQGATRSSRPGRPPYDVHRNLHQGKVGVLCLAPREGLGVRDTELREHHGRRSTGSAASDRHSGHAPCCSCVPLPPAVSPSTVTEWPPESRTCRPRSSPSSAEGSIRFRWTSICAGWTPS